MGFIGIFMLILPFIVAIIGIVIAILLFVGGCLVVIGVTGILMNKIYNKQMQTNCGVSKRLYNISSIVLGVFIMLLPIGYVLYEFISFMLR